MAKRRGAPWESYPVARLTHVASSRCWRLEVSVKGHRLRKYSSVPSGLLEEVLEEINEDRPFVFWG